jgi:ribonuclease VapC
MIVEPLIHDADHCLISAGSFLELSIVLEGQIGMEAVRQCDMFFRRAGIIVEPFSVEQAHLARQAFHDFGKGRHPAGLNLGDCFAYALARHTGEPLLFKGKDFKNTDIVSAL